MKKRIFIGLLCFFQIYVCAASGYEVGEGVTEMQVLHDYSNGCYVLYVQNGTLKALHEDSAGTILPYTLFPTDEGPSSVCTLTRSNNFLGRCGSFIANNNELYLYFLNHDDKFIFVHSLHGNIRDVRISHADFKTLEYFYIESGVLYCDKISLANNTVLSHETVSNQNSETIDYQILWYNELYGSCICKIADRY